MPESENTMYIRSNGIGIEGIKDQYADGKAAKVRKKNSLNFSSSKKLNFSL